jgi:hypothetical protein
MRLIRLLCASLAVLTACACTLESATPNEPRGALAETVRPDAGKAYQPLAKGDYWKYICNSQFTIEDRVSGTYRLAGRTVYALSLQIPSSPKKSTYVVQLLANDSHGNTRIYGYVFSGKVHAVTPAEIVAANPVKGKHYNFPGPKGGTVSRLFKLFEDTNRTPLGVFWVAAYFESNDTHNYGYSLGRGVMEQDHGPAYRYDCLIDKYVVHQVP